MSAAPTFPALLEAFFTDRLIRQRQASPHTLASYRDTFCLLLAYAQRQLRKGGLARHLAGSRHRVPRRLPRSFERDRDNSARSRNVRLAAIHSFFRYVALHAPEHSALAQRVLAIPSKRYVRRPVAFLSSVEVAALLAAPDLSSWIGRRDRALLLLAVQTGLRAAEIVGLRCEDIVLGPAAYVQCQGKGRKLRNTPLRKDTVTVLLAERRGRSADPAFPTISGTSLSHDALQYLLNKHLAVARRHCPSLASKHVTPHVLRHTLAMDLLQHGVDRSVIALWLGHESVETTAIYLQADMKLKEQALAMTDTADIRLGRYKPDDHLLAFLKSL
ncbi:integrase [Mesorhizobium amorphae]|uniref:tyrosine-type recombinase/integrase n=1 Tax=Mesorhizobium amorphae TaxID=71433 RepID=UPI00235D4989|nr:tyrosine-type recombinase/integrase [Mesorhizobium amorphae]GLR45778.1 integrase [Mesorhizobium amorphae]